MKLNLISILLCLLTLSGCNSGGSNSQVQTTTENSASTTSPSNSFSTNLTAESANTVLSSYSKSEVMLDENSELRTDINGITYLVGTNTADYTAQTNFDDFSGATGNMVVQQYLSDSHTFSLKYKYNNDQHYNCYHTTGFDLDSKGNLYIVGYSTLTCEDTSHARAIVMKYNPAYSGKVWAHEFGEGEADAYSYDIKAFDISVNKDDDSIYIVGSTSEQLGNTSQIGKIDAFVARLDSNNGDILSLTQFGGKNASVYPKAITCYNDSLIITGSTDQKINSSNTGQTGLHDAFISVIDKNTNKLSWTYQFGAANGNTYATSAAIINKQAILTVVGYTDKGILGQSQKGKVDYFIVQWYFSPSTAITNSQVARLIDQRGMSGTSSYAYNVNVMPTTDINGPNSSDVFVEGSTSAKLFEVCDYQSGICNTESGIKGISDSFIARYGNESASYSMYGAFEGGIQFDYPLYGLSSNSLGVTKDGIIMLPVNIYNSEKCTPSYVNNNINVCLSKYSSVLEWKINSGKHGLTAELGI